MFTGPIMGLRELCPLAQMLTCLKIVIQPLHVNHCIMLSLASQKMQSSING